MAVFQLFLVFLYATSYHVRFSGFVYHVKVSLTMEPRRRAVYNFLVLLRSLPLRVGRTGKVRHVLVFLYYHLRGPLHYLFRVLFYTGSMLVRFSSTMFRVNVLFLLLCVLRYHWYFFMPRVYRFFVYFASGTLYVGLSRIIRNVHVSLLYLFRRSLVNYLLV